IFKHATGNTMTVGIETQSGFACSRTLEKKEKKDKKTGKVTVTISESINLFPGRQEKNETQKRERITEELGEYPVILDFEQFLNKTATQKRDFLYSLGGSEIKIDKTYIEDYLREKILTGDLLEGNP